MLLGAEWPISQGSFHRGGNPPLGDADIVLFLLNSRCPPSVQHSSNQCGAHSGERVKDDVSFPSQGEDQAFNKLNWKLSRMNRLLRVVGLDVRDVPYELLPILCKDFPHVSRVLALWISRRLTVLRSLVVGLARILLRDSDGGEVEQVIVTLREP